MSTLSLKQLKEENAADETIADEAVKEEAEALEEHINDDDTSEETAESEEESGNEEADDTGDEEKDEEKDEVEEWMKTGEDEEPEKKEELTNDIARSIRLRATAKAERKVNAELEDLRKQNEALLAAQNTHVSPQGLSMPNRDDYLDQDDPDTAFLVALSEYNSKKQIAEITASQQAIEAKRQQDSQKEAITKNVDKHYEAAVKLAENSSITADSYRSADLAVRQMVEELYPDAGDALVDAFISKVGAGSERVFYSLGVNKNRLSQFRDTLVNDPTGLDAAIFLGGLNKELNKATKRRSTAPAPAPNVTGDAVTNSGERASKKAYDAAHKKGDTQAAYNAKKKAKSAGIDTGSW